MSAQQVSSGVDFFWSVSHAARKWMDSKHLPNPGLELDNMCSPIGMAAYGPTQHEYRWQNLAHGDYRGLGPVNITAQRGCSLSLSELGTWRLAVVPGVVQCSK